MWPYKWAKVQKDHTYEVIGNKKEGQRPEILCPSPKRESAREWGYLPPLVSVAKRASLAARFSLVYSFGLLTNVSVTVLLPS